MVCQGLAKAWCGGVDEYENDRISAVIQNAFYFQIGRNCDQLLVFSAEMEKQQEMQNQDENGAK